VNQVFADDHFDGLATGRLIRFVSESDSGGIERGPWLEIVGVVRDFAGYQHEPSGRIYVHTDVAQLLPPAKLDIRLRAGPVTSFIPRLRELALSVDPALQLDGLTSAAERHRQISQVPRYLAIGTTAAMVSALLLSAAGIYAMMSFTVTRRRREIGIRSALGADPRHVLTSIFARASAQISAGIVLGVIGAVVLDRVTGRGPVNDGNAVVVPFVALVMAAIGSIAAIGPARRGLAVQPTEALREE
jgi:hypothetical protein